MITRTNQRTGGFSFIEILFAIAILGVGFIMIAGVFPVAIQQTKMTQEEAMAQLVGQAADTLLISSFTTIPEMNGAPGHTGGWNWNVLLLANINGSRISSANPRYAWIPFYQFDTGTPMSAQFIPIVVESRNTAAFTAGMLDQLAPVQTNVTIEKDAGGVGVHRITFSGWGANGDESVLVEGAAIALSSQSNIIFRLGPKVSGTTWELAVGTTLNSNIPAVAGLPVPAWVIGRSLADPTIPWDATNNPFEGPSMVIGVGDVKGVTF